MRGVSDDILESITCGVIFVDTEGVIGYLNAKAESLLGVDRQVVVGKRVEMLPLREPLYRVLSENCAGFSLDMSIQGRSINVRNIDVRGEDGFLRGVITQLRDITEEKRERRQREEFVAMMTHDLKSPVTVIFGYLQAIREGSFGDITPCLVNCLDEMEGSGYRLLDMIEDVLDSYRLEAGLMEIHPEPCDVAGLLAGCCHDYQREAKMQEVELSLTMEEKIPIFTVDPKQMTRVFNNLLGNAIKFTPRKGRVAVKAYVTGKELHVEVEDTGIGISREDLVQIFKKYYRTAEANGYKGTGLGLTISRAIVEAHGGTIEADSSLGKGSRFTVIIPQLYED